MEFSLAGTVLTKDVFSADGRLVASRGEIVDLTLIREVAAKAPQPGREKPLFETSTAEAVLEAFEAPALANLVGTEPTRAVVADALSEVRFPQEVWDELEALRREDGPRYQHAIWTAMVAARLFRAALGTAPGLSRLVGGALTHDIGMRHTATRLRFKRDHLTRSEALALEDHPLLGALILANILGDAAPVHYALLHHARSGHGYPKVKGKAPLRGLDIISAASAFAALIAPRSYRLQAFNPRGAVDQLQEEAQKGAFDPRAVRLLIHCMRGSGEPITDLVLPRKPTGFRPPVNHHGVAANAA